jgi:hypothetical protein
MEASVLDTTLVLPIAAMKRKRDSAIWFTQKYANSCRKNL